MKITAILITVGAIALSACEVVPAKPVQQLPSPQEQIMTQLVNLAAPNQNVQAARLNPIDNCFWVPYVGPVETTELPLLSRRGGAICAPAPAVPEVATPS